jgi:hypothetical protein
MIATRIICKMINPPAKDQTGSFNLFIEPPPPQIYGCIAVADENVMSNYSRLHYREFHEGPFPGRIAIRPMYFAMYRARQWAVARVCTYDRSLRSLEIDSHMIQI